MAANLNETIFMNYNIIIIGSGPGGYVAAIRASQLGNKVAVVERESLGGICLNWGCIPTKALLKSAQVFEYIKNASDFGIEVGDSKPVFTDMIKRSRGIADSMSKGIEFLFRKNKIDVIYGNATLERGKKVKVIDENGEDKTLTADHIIIATGARSTELKNLKIDGKKIIGYREAMNLKKQPAKMVVVGAGAIGVEFAYFYHSIGTEVKVVEFLEQGLLPREDPDISKELSKVFRKAGIEVMANTSLEKVDIENKLCRVTVKNRKSDSEATLNCDVVLAAVGVTPNTGHLGLDSLSIEMNNGWIKTDPYYQTNIPGVYAIGDCIPGPALAHVASAEGIVCVEKISGLMPEPINYNNIPSCTYCHPEVASVGYTETAAKEAGYEVKVGRFPFTASGRAKASGDTTGFVKVIYDAKYGEWLGSHMIGDNVTELIAEVIVARKLETTGHEIIKTIHPHPTMSEAIMEATADAFGEVIHL